MNLGELRIFCNDFKIDIPRNDLVLLYKLESDRNKPHKFEQFKNCLKRIAQFIHDKKIKDSKKRLKEIKKKLGIETPKPSEPGSDKDEKSDSDGEGEGSGSSSGSDGEGEGDKSNDSDKNSEHNEEKDDKKSKIEKGKKDGKNKKDNKEEKDIKNDNKKEKEQTNKEIGRAHV